MTLLIDKYPQEKCQVGNEGMNTISLFQVEKYYRKL